MPNEQRSVYSHECCYAQKILQLFKIKQLILIRSNKKSIFYLDMTIIVVPYIETIVSLCEDFLVISFRLVKMGYILQYMYLQLVFLRLWRKAPFSSIRYK